MRRALKAHRKDFVAILVLVAGALAVAGYVLYHQPSFTFGQSYYSVRAEFATSAAVTPGQGQAITIAGVQVGLVGGVQLDDGRAVVTMNIFKKYAPIYRDATVLLRPRTPLKDMYLAVDPGTRQAGAVPPGGLLGAGSTAPDIDLDQILASLDGDTRSYLLLLLSGGAGAFRNPATAVPALQGTFKRFEPLGRDARTFATLLAARSNNLRLAIHDLQRVATALGGVDGQLASLIESSNTNFAAISSQAANLEAGLSLLPGTLVQTNQTLGKVEGLHRPARPGAHETAAVRSRARPRADRVAAAVPRHDAGDPESAAAVLGGGAAAREGAEARGDEVVEGGAAADAVGRRDRQAVQHARVPAERKRAGLPVLGLVACPYREQPDRSPGRPGPDRARDLHGELPATQPARDDDPAGQSVDRAAARLTERSRLEQDQLAVLPARAPECDPARGDWRGVWRMNRQAPSTARILTMVAFAGSCIGLLLFLWISFGGSTSLSPRGYEISAEFDQAENLGSQADVRISGVNVGKVIGVGLDRRTGLTRAVMEIDPQFVPRPADTRAILRQKTLLGETYVELSPGSPTGPKLADGATLPKGQIAPTVQLDQILSTFDPATRQAFETWMQQQGTALTGRGQDLNAALAELYPFATNVDSVLAVLNRDSAATSTLLNDGGQVLAAVTRSPTALQQLVNNANTTFSATAAQAAALAATIKAFPPFLKATKTTIDRVARFSVTTKPLVDELRPAAVQLSPALESLAVLAPKLNSLLVNIGPLTTASKAGVPAVDDFLNDSVPLLTRLTPYLGGVIPVVDYINTYRREVAAFFANGTAASQATSPAASGNGVLHYVRVSSPLNPETLTDYSTRSESNRGNPYLIPGGYSSLVSQLPVFGSYLCTSNPQPTIGPTISASLAAVLSSVYYTTDPGGPPCKAQQPLGAATTGQSQAFPQLQPIP